MDAPPNVCTPTHIASAAAQVQQAYPDVFSLEILEEADCRSQNMGLYLGVAECSLEPPKFIHLTYKSPGVLPSECMQHACPLHDVKMQCCGVELT